MKLLNVDDNIQVEIISCKGGRGISSKLRQLGFMPGDRITVIQRAPFNGPLLVEANGRTVALGRGVAGKIEVKACV
ncbi:MAG: ferrous iron transport protein A [Anaerolineales bacterium]|nr:ferrous iron transport protein A [Anaerolineales bacterium]